MTPAERLQAAAEQIHEWLKDPQAVVDEDCEAPDPDACRRALDWLWHHGWFWADEWRLCGVTIGTAGRINIDVDRPSGESKSFQFGGEADECLQFSGHTLLGRISISRMRNA